MTKTTVYLPDDILAAVKRIAVHRGVSEAEVIRESLRQAVVKERPRPQGGLFSSSDLTADRVDELLTGFGSE